jgi:Na+/proline symporter
MIRLRRFAATARRALATLALVMTASASVLACPVCFGGAEGALIDGAKLGVLALVGVTLAVQGAFVGFFLYLRKRAKHAAEAELETEWLELQRGSRSS